MKKNSILFLMLSVIIISGCDALGIKEKNDDSVQAEPLTTAVTNNQLSGSSKDGESTSQQVAALQNEIDELVSTLNMKDTTIADMENKIIEMTSKMEEISSEAAKTKASFDNIQSKISINNQYRNIAIIVAAVSIILNVILVYMLIKARAKYSRAALPPAKSDEHILHKDENKTVPLQNNIKNEGTQNHDSSSNKDVKPARRGRPKAAGSAKQTSTSQEKQKTTPAKKGRVKKNTEE